MVIDKRLLQQIQDHMRFKQLSKHLPQPGASIREDTNKYGRTALIADVQFLSDPAHEYLRYLWLDLYYKFLRDLAEVFLGHEDWFVFRLLPMVYRTDHMDRLELSLVAEIFKAPRREYIIPEFTYRRDPFTHEQRLVEWKCGYCKHINPISARECGEEDRGGCGAPRVLLIQEM